MAEGFEKHYYIARENLKEKYKGYEDRIKCFSKAIADQVRVKIFVQAKSNRTVQFIITGRKNGVSKALLEIQREFEISKVHQTTRAEDTFLKEDSHKILLCENNITLLTEKALRKHDILTGASQLRQFACRPCNRFWWTFVPRTKPVSDCLNCKVRFDALERTKEFGIGRYICQTCEHTFFARCEATEKHICFKCQKLVGPPFISPRFKQKKKLLFRSYEEHSILRVINASKPHDSTGSTVATFLTQDMGSNMYVEILHDYLQAAKDQTEPDDCDLPSKSAKQKYEEGEEDDDDYNSKDDDDQDSTSGEVGDLSSESNLSEFEEVESSELSYCDSQYSTYSRRRSRESDSESSEDEDKESVESSVPDSGISTWSHTRSGSSTDTLLEKSHSTLSICSFSSSDYPGVAFSKDVSQLKVTHEGGTIVGEGIHLFIPHGAIPQGDSPAISLQACIGGPFYLPKGLQFVSPVYLAQPPFAFHENVILSLEVFAKLESEKDCDELVFVTSPSKHDIVDKEARWKFEVDQDKEPSFHIGKKIGKIELKHFCFFGFAGYSPKISYCVLYHAPKDFSLRTQQCNAIFSVSVDSSVYKNNLERFVSEKYKDEEFMPATKSITLSSNKVTVAIDGMEQKEYTIRSLVTPCEISAKEIDLPKIQKKKAVKDYTMYPPRVQLKITQIAWSDMPFDFPLKVSGISNSKLSFNIFLNPCQRLQFGVTDTSTAASSYSSFLSQISTTSLHCQGSPQEHRSSSQEDGASAVIPIKQGPTLKALLNILNAVAPKWEMLAINLDLKVSDIEAIKCDEEKVYDKLKGVFIKWRKSADPEKLNWMSIVEALRNPSVNELRLAEDIRTRLM